MSLFFYAFGMIAGMVACFYGIVMHSTGGDPADATYHLALGISLILIAREQRE